MLYVPFANTLVRDTVVDFLNRPDFAKDLKQISATLRSPFVANSLTGGENLGYLPDYVDPSCLAGFHASEITRLNWAVCVWAAVKLGQLDDEGPYVYYDNEKISIDLSPTDPGPANIWSTANGVMHFDRKPSVLKKLFPNLANKRIVQFIEKLNTVWESENRLQPTAPKM